MNRYRSGEIIVEDIPLLNDLDTPYSASSVAYRVVDESNIEIIHTTPITNFVVGSAFVAITIPAINNILSVGKIRGMRSIELKITLSDTSVFYTTYDYIIEAQSTLMTMINSYQTMGEAKLMLLNMSEMSAWETSSDQKISSAMTEAFYRMGLLRYDVNGLLIPSNENTAVTNKFDYDFMDTQSVSTFRVRPSLSSITIEEFNNLPTLFTDAVKKAQISEADIILGGDPLKSKRDKGIISDKVGESTTVFKAAMPLNLPVDRRTLSYLSGWVTYRPRLSRR